MSCIEDVIQNTMKRFDTIDKNVKETQKNLSRISQKVDAHGVWIKQLE